jgi:NTP pyrophosphatase (non-canonical NTP hydrolase)
MSLQFRKICDNTNDMSATELAHNHAFVKDGEAWYRDYEREISVRDLMREICVKHGSPEDAAEMDDETLDETLYDNLQFGTDELEGVFSMFYMSLYGMADLREWLKQYIDSGLPVIKNPEVIKEAVETYGSRAQVDMAIEEMSELTKALCKERRYELTEGKHAEARANVIEEMADVTIMLAQLILIFDRDNELQQAIDYKINRLTGRLKEAATDAAQEVLQAAT